MPLLLSRSDLSGLAAEDDELDGAIDAVEESITQCASGVRAQTIFTGLDLAGGDELATQIVSLASGPATLRIFPNRVKGERPNAWLGLQLEGATGAVDSMIALDDFNVLRTSVPAAVGVRHLAPADASRLTVLGSGPQARSHVRTIRRVMPGLEELRLWSPSRESRTAFGADLHARLGGEVRVSVADTLDEAVDGADVITAAGRYSHGEAAVPDPESVRPGALLVSMTGAGGNLLERGARLAVPTSRRPEVVAFGFAGGFIGDAPPPAPAGTLELADVIAGNMATRSSHTDTIVFELGAPYQWDVPILAWIRAWADERGLGTTFDFSG
jgi:alanine dehydrogenase